MRRFSAFRTIAVVGLVLVVQLALIGAAVAWGGLAWLVFLGCFALGDYLLARWRKRGEL